MIPFKTTKEAIQFANEHLISGDFFNNLILTATPISDNIFSTHNQSEQVDIVQHLYDWSLTPISHSKNRQRSRLFYLFGDFGSGKSGVCKALISKLYNTYEESRYGDTTAKPTLPIYFNLRVLTGIYGDFEFASKRLAELIEVMFYATGTSKINDIADEKGVDGDDIIKLVRQYPCVVVFDGFDEAVQKLSKSQQNGFLNKLLSILPSAQYTKDLMRIIGQPVEESTIPDSPSHLVISCRTQLFESKQEQTAFSEAFYGTKLSINGIKNYQAYQLNNLPKNTVRSSFQRTIYNSNKRLPEYQQLDLRHEDSQIFVDYLVDLSINPLLMSFAKSLLPSIKPSLEKTGFINSAEMFSDLITNLMQRDSSKGIINVQEKQKILGAVALKIWQERMGFISLENLRQFFYAHYTNYRQIQLGIDTGRVELEVALQDLHSSMIVRDDTDMYFFCHPLIFDYFLAVGIFEVVKGSVDSAASLSPIVDYVFKVSKKNNQTILTDMLTDDSLIFISQMVMSFIHRRDMNSYNHFSKQWLKVCEEVISVIKKRGSYGEEQARKKGLSMWKIVIGEDNQSVNNSCLY